MMTLAWFGLPGGSEWIIIGLVALLLFGRRLPEVGRALGQSIVQFKKGIKGIEDEVEQAANSPDSAPLKPYDKRLGGNEEELRRLQEQGAAPPEFKREKSTPEASA